MSHSSRRRWITSAIAATAGVSGIAVAARIARHHGLIPPDSGTLYGTGATLTYAAQRLITSHALAREFPRSQMSPAPFVNGPPYQAEDYKRHQAAGFSSWRLAVDGLVARPGNFSLDQLRSCPASTHITALTCEEGWSYIAEWTGVPLAHILQLAGAAPHAKFVVYSSIEPGWWDSIDMADALHPQTLIAHTLNREPLPTGNGGPLRLRLPRQLGYKSLKYLTRLTVTDNLQSFGKGLGSAGPEAGYSWYAGI